MVNFGKNCVNLQPILESSSLKQPTLTNILRIYIQNKYLFKKTNIVLIYKQRERFLWKKDS